jgi:hypothetical protein
MMFVFLAFYCYNDDDCEALIRDLAEPGFVCASEENETRLKTAEAAWL